MYLITTPAVFLNQTHLVRLGIFHLELGKKTTLFGFGNGAEFQPQISEIESPGWICLDCLRLGVRFNE